MLWGKKALRVIAAVAVAVAAAHTAESQKGQEAQQSLLLTAAQRAEFKKESDALTAEWDTRQQALLAKLRTDHPDGEWTRD